jgi:hypothetical protein
MWVDPSEGVLRECWLIAFTSSRPKGRCRPGNHLRQDVLDGSWDRHLRSVWHEGVRWTRRAQGPALKELLVLVGLDRAPEMGIAQVE